MSSTNTLLNGIIITFVLVILTGIVLTSFNATFEQDYNLGLETGGLDDISSALGSAYNQTDQGEVTQVSDGLSLKSSWAISKGLFNVVWSFVNGSWITNVIALLNMGASGYIIGVLFRLLFVVILIFSIIKLFFKVGL